MTRFHVSLLPSGLYQPPICGFSSSENWKDWPIYANGHALTIACRDGEFVKVKDLLNAGADPNAVSNGYSASSVSSGPGEVFVKMGFAP